MPGHEGIDLPVHDPDTVVATTGDLNGGRIREITDGYSKPKFVRAVMVQLRNLSHAPGSTKELLEWTDRELEAVAEACGALVLEHEWGLYPVAGKGQAYQRYKPANRGLGGIIDLPRDHILVAEVDTIRPAAETMSPEALSELMASSAEAITQGLPRYYTNGAYQMFDFRYDPARNALSGPRFDHFAAGIPVGAPEGTEPATYVVDLDPRFGVTGC